jgi:hypothetical protein
MYCKHTFHIISNAQMRRKGGTSRANLRAFNTMMHDSPAAAPARLAPSRPLENMELEVYQEEKEEEEEADERGG